MTARCPDERKDSLEERAAEAKLNPPDEPTLLASRADHPAPSQPSLLAVCSRFRSFRPFFLEMSSDLPLPAHLIPPPDLLDCRPFRWRRHRTAYTHKKSLSSAWKTPSETNFLRLLTLMADILA